MGMIYLLMSLTLILAGLLLLAANKGIGTVIAASGLGYLWYKLPDIALYFAALFNYYPANI